MNSNLNFSTSLRELCSSFWRHRELVARMAKRDVIGRYRGSVMGLAWSFFNPLLMLVVYTFVFSMVFQARWGEGVADTKTEFAMLLFTGMMCMACLPNVSIARQRSYFPMRIT